jgi:hypothetical protein
MAECKKLWSKVAMIEALDQLAKTNIDRVYIVDRYGALYCEQIEWGYIIPYMLTGILNEHPRAAIAYRETPSKDKYTEFYERLLEGVIGE